jgi:eukaryotic-like serine/threonine-protein kinase
MGWNPQRGDAVVDRDGTHFELRERLAEGGQGVVFTTQAAGAAVKISTSHHDEDGRAAIERQLRRVARLPMGDLPVALPRRTLREPAVGYTMSLLTGMMSVGSLAQPGSNKELVPWFVETGGLRKRLAVLESLAEIFASLHGRGLVYGDLNDENALVSEHPERARVFLIDLDNLQPADLQPRRIYTVPFAAPEQPDTGATQASDAFSLAVLAFAMLAGTNPFDGRVFDGLPPEEFREAPRPYADQVPWVDDPDDASNRAVRGLPRPIVTTPRLRALFHRAFVEGRRHPHLRPAASSWARAARAARLATTRCGHCGWDTFVTATACACCDRLVRHEGYRLLELEGVHTHLYPLCPYALLVDGVREVPPAALGFAEAPDKARAVRLERRPEGVAIELLHPAISFEARPASRSTTVASGDVFILQRARRSPLVFAPFGMSHGPR